MRPAKIAGGLFFAVALAFGVTFYRTPANELLYDSTLLPVVCSESGCVGSYVTRIGNTGKNTASAIEVTINWPPGAKLLLPPALKSEGKIARPISTSEIDGGSELQLGALEPGRWVDLSYTLSFATREAVPPPRDVLTAVHSEHGPGRPGSPTGTRFLRALWALFEFI